MLPFLAAYILSNFRYCPLIWMFCSKGDNSKIVQVQQRSIRIVHRDFKTPSGDLLRLYSCESIHLQNLKLLALEVFKSANKLNPSFMWEMFQPKQCTMSLRCGHRMRLPGKSESTTNGFVFRAVLLWNNLPKSLKNAATLNLFKIGLENNPTPLYCQCRICDV